MLVYCSSTTILCDISISVYQHQVQYLFPTYLHFSLVFQVLGFYLFLQSSWSKTTYENSGNTVSLPAYFEDRVCYCICYSGMPRSISGSSFYYIRTLFLLCKDSRSNRYLFNEYWFSMANTGCWWTFCQSNSSWASKSLIFCDFSDSLLQYALVIMQP